LLKYMAHMQQLQVLIETGMRMTIVLSTTLLYNW
jgi:hypothetical protein